ncbi:MAG: hypothetical protein J6T57_03195 [Alphaproteobacteria bacterium]|nr:hypothetical protein [Alphaproteobacteria bacterium]
MVKIKEILKHPITTHSAVALIVALVTWGLRPSAEEKLFQDNEDSALHTFRTEYVDPVSGQTVTAANFGYLNREYFDPNNFPEVNWVNYSNTKIGQIFGEYVAKEMACGIDSVNNHLTTPGKKYRLDYNYCTKAATTAVRDAEKRMGFVDKKGKAKKGRFELFSEKGGDQAIYNGDETVKYFKRLYESVPGAIIENPTSEDFKRLGAGSILRFPGHTKIYMGLGFVDMSGKVFVPSNRGRPVMASGYNDTFSYCGESENCIAIDLSKIVTHKFQDEIGRNTR